MATNARRPMPEEDIEFVDTTDAGTDISPTHLTKQEFGRRLQNLMIEKGWNQSELARRAGLGRDAISTYVRGRSFPEPINLKKVADALSVNPHDLLPNTVEWAMANDEHPALEIKQSATHPDKVWIRVNQLVSFAQAAIIFNALHRNQEE